MSMPDETLEWQLGQVAVPVHDLDRATAFYRDVVGLEHLFRAPPGLAFFRCGSVRLMLTRPEDPDMAPPGSILYLTVDDLGAAHERLAESGATVVREPHVVHATETSELRMAFYRDSEGNVFATMHEGAPE